MPILVGKRSLVWPSLHLMSSSLTMAGRNKPIKESTEVEVSEVVFWGFGGWSDGAMAGAGRDRRRLGEVAMTCGNSRAVVH